MAPVINPLASIADLRDDLHSRRISATELVKTALDRVDTCDARLHAFVRVFREGALSRAAALDRDMDNGVAAGPLAGIPVAIKDLFDIAGVPTRAGSTATPDRPASSTAFCVQKLISAGATILGKTHTVEFAFGGWGTNVVTGTPWNPWDLETHRVPGGSSSGSAVAVASGMAVAALGTDTGGSVRTPASHCGLVGMKTSSGLVSRHGVFPLCPSHDTVGTLTRGVEDAALLLDVISGPDSNDPATLSAPEIRFLPALHDGVDGMEIGVLEPPELVAASAEIRRLYERCLDILRTAGAKIDRHGLPRSLNAYLDDAGRLMSAESYVSLRHLVEPGDSPVAPEIRARVLAGKTISADDHADILARRDRDQRTFLAGLGDCRALVMPTCSHAAIALDAVDETAIVTPFGRFVNYLDLAAVSVPMGLTGDGLPAGLQIVVRKFDDALALRIARVIETAVGTFHPRDL